MCCKFVSYHMFTVSFLTSAVLGEGRIPISCHSKTCNSWPSWRYNKGRYIPNKFYLCSTFKCQFSPTCSPCDWNLIVSFCVLKSQGYGCLGLSLTASAISTAEVARVDTSCSTFILVHASLVVPTIGKSIVSLPFILYVPWDAQEQLLCTPKLSVSIFIFFCKT